MQKGIIAPNLTVDSEFVEFLSSFYQPYRPCRSFVDPTLLKELNSRIKKITKKHHGVILINILHLEQSRFLQGDFFIESRIDFLKNLFCVRLKLTSESIHQVGPYLAIIFQPKKCTQPEIICQKIRKRLLEFSWLTIPMSFSYGVATSENKDTMLSAQDVFDLAEQRLIIDRYKLKLENYASQTAPEVYTKAYEWQDAPEPSHLGISAAELAQIMPINLDKSNFLIFSLDLECRFKVINRAFSQQLLYCEDEIIGEKLAMIFIQSLDKEVVISQIEKSLQAGYWQGEVGLQNKRGQLLVYNAEAHVLFDENGERSAYLVYANNITEYQYDKVQMRKMDYYDAITNLPNRHFFYELLEKKIQECQEVGGVFTLFYMDIDGFQDICDVYGYTTAQEILQRIALRLSMFFNYKALLSHVGLDRFAAVIPGTTEFSLVKEYFSRVRELLDIPILIQETQRVHINLTTGIACYPEHGENLDTLLTNARTAKNYLKKNHAQEFVWYNEKMAQHSQDAILMKYYINRALTEELFYLEYQPKVALGNSNEITGFEALVRMNLPGIGNIEPNDFIAIAESSGLIVKVGTWVLENACKQAKIWIDKGFVFKKISINIAAQQLQDIDFLSKLNTILAKYPLDPQHLEFEITETMFLNQDEIAIDNLKMLSDMGIEITIDDFGTGYASLSYLTNLPIDRIKIDRSFVFKVVSDKNSRAIIETLIALAKALELDIIAVGVENYAQKQVLEDLGCATAQGFYFYRPERPEFFEINNLF